ncbi:hypothetical protein [Vibrio sp. SCSIO 43155]|uniref:hypothetical protein n=1 Tax=Vibrio sp. SCSIO 43155 TaxID=2819099 RepID=UPI002075C692|nr:hypothetical protein [Vibrio sp. SCSIO 43155]USD58604.1 hypothetical protein J4N44_27005 [Vibrio sp. SCSIO 43155]
MLSTTLKRLANKRVAPRLLEDVPSETLEQLAKNIRNELLRREAEKDKSTITRNNDRLDETINMIRKSGVDIKLLIERLENIPRD